MVFIFCNPAGATISTLFYRYLYPPMPIGIEGKK